MLRGVVRRLGSNRAAVPLRRSVEPHPKVVLFARRAMLLTQDFRSPLGLTC
jgi:hypothetical protein